VAPGLADRVAQHRRRGVICRVNLLRTRRQLATIPDIVECEEPECANFFW
jgi:hypothetical protein